MSERGLECPRCGCMHSYVLKTIRRLKAIQRRRKCRNCDRRFLTTEKMTQPPEKGVA